MASCSTGSTTTRHQRVVPVTLASDATFWFRARRDHLQRDHQCVVLNLTSDAATCHRCVQKGQQHHQAAWVFAQFDPADQRDADFDNAHCCSGPEQECPIRHYEAISISTTCRCIVAIRGEQSQVEPDVTMCGGNCSAYLQSDAYASRKEV